MNTAGARPLAIESGFCIDQGFELIDYGPGWTILACDVQPRHANRRGNAHGGLLAALLDTAMGLATRAGGDIDNLGTASLTVNYLKPASGRLAVHAHVRRSGRTLAFCEADVRNGDDEVVATASAVFAVAAVAR